MTKLKSEARMRQELEDLKHKAPRAGVRPTKIVPDKTKYTRKVKHRTGVAK